MIGRARGDCLVHQAALLDFADRRERTAGTAAALAHLERCRRCEDDQAGIVRTIAGLRRLADSVALAEPGREAWPMLRARVTRPEPPRSRWRYPAGGLVAAAMVALFVLPSVGGVPVVPSTIPAEPQGLIVVDRRYESPPGALTADMVNAIAGQDVSQRARLRSALFHIAPSSVDRDEPSRTSRNLAGSADDGGMPVAIAPS
jgi:hypothetical protein